MKKLALLPLFLALACQSGGITSEQKAKLVESYQETAQQYYTMGDLDRANSQCLKGLAVEPGNDRLRLIQAWTLLRRGGKSDIAQAETTFRSLQKGNDFRAVLGLAEALERKGLLFSESAANLRSGKRVTEASDPTKRIADIETQALKAWEESLSYYMAALKLQKEPADVYSGLARVETLRGNQEAALGWSQKLIEVTRADRLFWNERLTRADMTTTDETRLRDIVRQRGRVESAAHLTSADLATQLGRDTEALAHLDEAISLEPDRADSYSRRAQIRQELGRFAEAITDLERFIALSDRDSNHPDIQRAFRMRRECQDEIDRR
ncbi:MAG: tetratricopeptide repeat protein [Planctomycetes bacterium]|nr:tetratricopeptide repeat protein [Planctomycetota bacterium]